jgi:hypothetical protein
MGMNSPMKAPFGTKDGTAAPMGKQAIDVRTTWEPGQGHKVKDPIGKIFQPVAGSGAKK